MGAEVNRCGKMMENSRGLRQPFSPSSAEAYSDEELLTDPKEDSGRSNKGKLSGRFQRSKVLLYASNEVVPRSLGFVAMKGK